MIVAAMVLGALVAGGWLLARAVDLGQRADDTRELKRAAARFERGGR